MLRLGAGDGSTSTNPANGIRSCKGRSSWMLSGRGLQTGPECALRLCCRIGNFRKRRDALYNLRAAMASIEAHGGASKQHRGSRASQNDVQSHGESQAHHARKACGTPLTPAGTDVARLSPLDYAPCERRVIVGRLEVFQRRGLLSTIVLGLLLAGSQRRGQVLVVDDWYLFPRGCQNRHCSCACDLAAGWEVAQDQDVVRRNMLCGLNPRR